MLICLSCKVTLRGPNQKKFCSASCSAQYNNRHRHHTDDTKLKISISSKLREANRTLEEKEQLAIKRANTLKKNRLVRLLNKDFDSLAHQTKRDRVIFEQDGKCAHCGLSEWMGKPICFELDHIDGDNKNNVRSNLEILCPNCHSNTPTWKGRKSAKNNDRIKEYVELKHEMVRAVGIEPTRLP